MHHLLALSSPFPPTPPLPTNTTKPVAHHIVHSWDVAGAMDIPDIGDRSTQAGRGQAAAAAGQGTCPVVCGMCGTCWGGACHR